MHARWQRLLEHLTWADARVVEALERALEAEAEAGGTRGREGPTPGVTRALGLLTHLLQAEAIWLARLEGRESGALEVWPEPSLDRCRTTARATHPAFAAFLDRLGADDPLVRYRNQTGRSFENRTSDILEHVFLHGAYHRGQIALLLRDAGVGAVNTDLITLVREGVR